MTATAVPTVPEDVTVFAAASLTAAFTEIGDAFTLARRTSRVDAHQIAPEWLERVGLADYARQRPRSSSGGQELLLKLVIAEICGVDVTVMLERQRDHLGQLADTLAARAAASPSDVVALWRSESATAAVRFIGRLAPSPR